MDSNNNYKQIIRKILEEINPYEDISDESNLIETGLLDSLAIVFLVTQLEDNYHIEINERLVIPDNFKNIETISRLLETLQQGDLQ